MKVVAMPTIMQQLREQIRAVKNNNKEPDHILMTIDEFKELEQQAENMGANIYIDEEFEIRRILPIKEGKYNTMVRQRGSFEGIAIFIAPEHLAK